MIKVFCLILLLLFPALANAANKYCDFSVAGGDASGDGTAGNPYQTIEKADDGLTGGDEVRVAKTTDVALTGTIAFVNGNTDLATSADLSGVLSAGDYIGKGTDTEAWWLVSSCDADSVTLTREYWGVTETVAAYEAGRISWTLNEQDIGVSGVSAANRLKITGGWDLTTETRTGYTFLDGDSTGGNGIDTNSRNYLEFSYFRLVEFDTAPLYVFGTAGSYLHHLFVGESTGSYNLCVVACGTNSFDTIVIGGSIIVGLNLLSNSPFNSFINIYTYSVGTGAGDYAISISDTCPLSYFKNIYLYNGSAQMFVTSSYVIVEDITIDTAPAAAIYFLLSYSNPSGSKISDPVVSNCTHGIYTYNPIGIEVYNPTFTSCSTADVFVSNIYAVVPGNPGGIKVHNYNGTANDDRIYFANGVIYKDSADARSGYCLKFDPSSATYPITWKVGTIKVTEAGDLTLSVYMKDDADFNGTVKLYATTVNRMAESFTGKTMTTSYAENTITVAAADLVDEEYMELWVAVTGLAGNVFVDDFSFSQ